MDSNPHETPAVSAPGKVRRALGYHVVGPFRRTRLASPSEMTPSQRVSCRQARSAAASGRRKPPRSVKDDTRAAVERKGVEAFCSNIQGKPQGLVTEALDYSCFGCPPRLANPLCQVFQTN